MKIAIQEDSLCCFHAYVLQPKLAHPLPDLFITSQSPSHGGLYQFKITLFAPLQWTHQPCSSFRFPLLSISLPCVVSPITVLYSLNLEVSWLLNALVYTNQPWYNGMIWEGTKSELTKVCTPGGEDCLGNWPCLTRVHHCIWHIGGCWRHWRALVTLSETVGRKLRSIWGWGGMRGGKLKHLSVDNFFFVILGFKHTVYTC
jgi:hypothetical protein